MLLTETRLALYAPAAAQLFGGYALLSVCLIQPRGVYMYRLFVYNMICVMHSPSWTETSVSR